MGGKSKVLPLSFQLLRLCLLVEGKATNPVCMHGKFANMINKGRRKSADV